MSSSGPTFHARTPSWKATRRWLNQLRSMLAEDAVGTSVQAASPKASRRSSSVRASRMLLSSVAHVCANRVSEFRDGFCWSSHANCVQCHWDDTAVLDLMLSMAQLDLFEQGALLLQLPLLRPSWGHSCDAMPFRGWSIPGLFCSGRAHVHSSAPPRRAGNRFSAICTGNSPCTGVYSSCTWRHNGRRISRRHSSCIVWPQTFSA